MRATPPAVGGGVPPTEQLGSVSEGNRASGSRVEHEPNASLVYATPPEDPVYGPMTRDESVLANASVLSGAGLNGPAGPGLSAAGVAGAGVAGTGAPGAGPGPVVTGAGPGTGGPGVGAQGAGGTVTMSGTDMAAMSVPDIVTVPGGVT